jgi:TonB dependent receptor-like, beta-barrel/CarboxypepD_reg-like domain
MKIKVFVLICMLLPAYSQFVQASPASANDSLSIWVNGACGMCLTRIEKAAMTVKGVHSASWDKETHQLALSIDSVKFKGRKLHYKMASVGHDTREILAPDPVYDALPQCCKYRGHSQVINTGKKEGGITGKVFETGADGSSIPLLGANIHWAGSSTGTSTGQDGHFSIDLEEGTHFLVVSYVGYASDTLHIQEPAEVEIEFSNAVMLEEVQVVHRIKPTSVAFNSAFHVQNIHEKELTKAACCNLSESFETNPSVDAGFTDAVTGTRKIEMLGLAGPYVQITRENMPDVRGLSALYGLTYTPGAWIEGIQLNMGAGSVVNGFESITGQINVELRKPENSDKLYLNLYGNSDGRMESNILSAYQMNEKWSGSLLLHGNSRPFQLDHNQDGFMDHPTGKQLVALKRIKYSGENGVESQMGIKVVWLDQLGGQLNFDPETPRNRQSYWGSRMNTRRLEGWAKVGKVFENRPYTSMGFQLSGAAHSQDAFFGLTDYLADHQSLYSNLIYQSILGSTNHQYRTGISIQADSYNETVGVTLYQRRELVPGAFLEYTFNYLDLFTAVAGIRADFHNNYGAFFTPRLHLKYEPREKTVFKASAGRGQKTASVFAENTGIFATSRTLYLNSAVDDFPYGLKPEVAWSYGLSFAQGFRIGVRESVFKLDYYHTDFQNQVVLDLDRNPQEVHFYNLEGESRSNSAQAQLDMEPLERYDIRIAYRFNDVQSTYGDVLMPRPLVAKHRAFINMAYATKSLWSIDLTWSWQGPKRIPGTESNPEPYRLEAYSPAFSLLNLQLGKTVFERLELYAGIENLLGFVQENPILASEDPFGPWFDSSLIWGPVYGRKFYGGLRFRLN